MLDIPKWQDLRTDAERPGDLNFVNDIALMAEDADALQSIINRLFEMAVRKNT